MNKETSLYLDIVRLLAALAVFIDHASSTRYTDGLFWQLASLGKEAVMVFFVLSGFVITYVTDIKETTAGTYALSRMSRVYSVALPALILTLGLDAIGRNWNPDLYTGAWGYQWTDRVSQFLHALFFFNQIWFNDIPAGSNLPYWSLGFEVWYYVLFGLLLFTRGKTRVGLVTLTGLVIGPKILVLMPIWLLGSLAYYLCAHYSLPRNYGLMMMLLSLIGWVGYEVYVYRVGMPICHSSLVHERLLYQDYIVGILFFIQLVGFYYASPLFSSILLPLARPIRWFAGATFSLYLFHMPLCQFISALSPWPASAWEQRSLIYVGVPIAILGLAGITERRKSDYRKLFRKLIPLGQPV